MQKPFLQQITELYKSLGSSNQANQQLIKLTKSQQSWQIAKHLITYPRGHIYGCTLLSTKLKDPYTRQLQAKYNLQGFLLSLPQLNKILLCCIAKVALHLDWQNLQRAAHLNPLSLIYLLKQIADVSQTITLAYPTDKQNNQKTRAYSIFRNSKGFLIQYFPIYPNDVIKCLQSYLEANYKVESQQIVKFLLTRPLDQTWECLNEILLCQKYENLNQLISQYLNQQGNTQNTSQYFIVYIAFARSLNLFQLPQQNLLEMLQRILMALQYEANLSIQQQRKYHFIQDSMQMWTDLQGNLIDLLDNQINTPQIQIILQSFVKLWQIIIQRCRLIYVPKKLKKINSGLQIINVDSQQQDNQQIIIQEDINKSRYKFRGSTGQDIIIRIFQTLRKRPDKIQKCFNFITSLLVLRIQQDTQQQQLNAQVAIFTFANFIESCKPSQTQNARNLLLVITQSKFIQNIYINQMLLELFEYVPHELIYDQIIFKIILSELNRAINIIELQRDACQTFLQIIQISSNSQSNKEFTPLLNQFFQFLYQQIYFKTDRKEVFYTLTKCFISFFHYFGKDEKTFQRFLQDVTKKILSMQDDSYQRQIIECIAHSHQMHKQPQRFTPIVSIFLVKLFPLFTSFIKTCPSKKLGNVFTQLSLMVGVGGGFNTSEWIKNLIQLTNIPAVNKDKSLIFNLFNKLMTVEKYDVYYPAQIVNLAKQAESFVTQTLLQANKQSFKVINKSLTFHYNILSKYVTTENFKNYNPDKVLVFIVEKIFKGFLNYQQQSTRTSLRIVKFMIANKYRAQQLLLQCLKIFPRIVDMQWQLLDDILFQSYKIGGESIFQIVFAQYKPSLSKQNPLFLALIQGIQQRNSKNVKSILSALN